MKDKDEQLIYCKELKKYLIEIFELLDIPTSQSVLGRNCIEFYAIRTCTAENRIKELKDQLKHKEQGCEELNSDNRYFVDRIMSLEELTDKYELAFDEIEKNIKDYCKNMCMTETKETCGSCQNTEVLDIIDRVKK